VHAHQCPLLYNRSGQTVATHLWKLFIESLQSVTAWEFDEEKRDMRDMHDKLRMEEIEDDRRFVTDYLLPTYRDESIGKFPNLMKQARLVNDNKDTRLYTKKSYLECHTMLLDLIVDFKESLVALYETKRTNRPSDQRHPGFQT